MTEGVSGTKALEDATTSISSLRAYSFRRVAVDEVYPRPIKRRELAPAVSAVNYKSPNREDDILPYTPNPRPI